MNQRTHLETGSSRRRVHRLKQWAGFWLLALGVLHIALAAAKFEPEWRAMAAIGFYNVIDGDAQRRAAVWFTLFGVLLLVVGLAVRSLERLRAQAELRIVGGALLTLTFIGVLLMPASGFWALYQPAVALLLNRAGAIPDTDEASPAAAATFAP